jgi:hypothetical protein
MERESQSRVPILGAGVVPKFEYAVARVRAILDELFSPRRGSRWRTQMLISCVVLRTLRSLRGGS